MTMVMIRSCAQAFGAARPSSRRTSMAAALMHEAASAVMYATHFVLIRRFALALAVCALAVAIPAEDQVQSATGSSAAHSASTAVLIEMLDRSLLSQVHNADLKSSIRDQFVGFMVLAMGATASPVSRLQWDDTVQWMNDRCSRYVNQSERPRVVRYAHVFPELENDEAYIFRDAMLAIAFGSAARLHWRHPGDRSWKQWLELRDAQVDRLLAALSQSIDGSAIDPSVRKAFEQFGDPIKPPEDLNFSGVFQPQDVAQVIAKIPAHSATLASILHEKGFSPSNLIEALNELTFSEAWGGLWNFDRLPGYSEPGRILLREISRQQLMHWSKATGLSYQQLNR